MSNWLSRLIASFLGFFSLHAHAYEKVFYSIYQMDKEVPSNQAAPIAKGKITTLLNNVSKGEKNFIGFIDNDDVTIQFYVDTLDKIWIEIPFPSEKGSYGKHVSVSEMHQIVSTLSPPYHQYKSKLNLHFEAW